MNETIPAWFREVVISGIEMLVVLRLKGTPAAEILELTATVWLDVIWKQNITWNELLDQERLEKAFILVAAQCEYWPAPTNLLKALRPREEPKALPMPKVSQEKAEANMARIKALTASLSKLKTVEKVKNRNNQND